MKRENNRRSGATLVVVVSIMLIGALITASVMARVNARANLAYRQVNLEEAFHVAEGGAERAAARITTLGYGNVGTQTISGSLGNGHYNAKITTQSAAGGGYQVDIISTGTVHNVSRVVKMSGVQRVSWARYALWYNKQSASLYMMPGEKFHGLFYSKPLLRFSNTGLDRGQVRFYDRAWTGQSSISKDSGAEPIFDRGLIYNYHSASEEDMLRDIDFATLKAQASSAMTFKGPTTIVLNGKKMTVTNAEKGYNKKELNIPGDGLVYVQSYTSGWNTYNGDLTVSAPNGLNERVTLVAEKDILIPDHIKYKNDPRTKADSTDALGLIAKQHVRVVTGSPKNLFIFAHVICQQGGFGVDDYKTVGDKGTLTVYGGIVNDTRNGVANTTTSRNKVTRNGYAKDYIFDKRFNNTPPPFYPEIPDQLEWSRWEG